MKSTTIKRIVAFLFLTVGILYIVMWFQKSSEGFQVLTCPTATIGGQVTYLCNSMSQAKMMLQTMTTPVPICYDSSTNTGQKASYVCYDTNGDPTFDAKRGVYIPFDPIADDDPMPQYAEQDIITNYTTFLSGYNAFIPAYQNTSSLTTAASTLGYANAIKVQSTLTSLSNLKCQGPTIDTRYINTCDAITRGLNTVNPLITDTGPNSLQSINNTLLTSKAEIKGLLYNKFMPGFFDSYVMNSAQKEDYLANK